MSDIEKSKRLNPLDDYLFKKYMGEKENEEQLISFLNAVLKRTAKDTIVDISIDENRLMSAEIKDNKSSGLDLRDVMKNGSKVNIEVQVRDAKDMDKRIVYYWGLEYTNYIEYGGSYQELPNVISIVVVGSQFPKLDEVHASFHLYEDFNKDFRFTEVEEIHVIDMVKFRRLKNKDIINNPFLRWLTSFDKSANDETLNTILEMNTVIKKAHDVIKHVLQDKEMLHAYHMHEMAIMDYNSGVYAAEQRGRVKDAIKMKKRRYSAGKITEIVEMTETNLMKIFKKQGLV
jgi:predicted transposase/invertase (TIGR01784 family)